MLRPQLLLLRLQLLLTALTSPAPAHHHTSRWRRHALGRRRGHLLEVKLSKPVRSASGALAAAGRPC